MVMRELPVRQQKYPWSCVIDCTCAAMQALTGKYVETDEILDNIYAMFMTPDYYKDLPEKYHAKTTVRRNGDHILLYTGLSEAVEKVSGEVVMRIETYDKIYHRDGFGNTRDVPNEHFPIWRNSVLRAHEERDGKGLRDGSRHE